MTQIFRTLIAAFALAFTLGITDFAHAESASSGSSSGSSASSNSGSGSGSGSGSDDDDAPQTSPRRGRGRHVLAGVANLNTADSLTLEMLPGIGESKAAAILAYRQKHAFKRVDDLDRVKGFGRKTLSKLRPYLSVSGNSTLSEGDGEAVVAASEPASAPKSQRASASTRK